MSCSPISRYLSVFFCALLLGACDDQSAGSSSGRSPRTEQISASQQANRQSVRWQQQFDAEHALRMQAETHLSQQEAARSWWQTCATLLAIAAVVLLGLGATLGSAARHESQKS